jgi:hypothetical protein
MFDNLRKYAAAYAVAIGGVLLTCLSSWNVRQELQTSHFKEFQWAAGDRIQSVRAVVDQGLDALLEIRGCSMRRRESTKRISWSSPIRCSNAARTSTVCCGRRC